MALDLLRKTPFPENAESIHNDNVYNSYHIAVRDAVCSYADIKLRTYIPE